jgi:hypothetical protein
VTRADSSTLLVVQRGLDGFVQTARRQVRFDAAIERAGACILIEPQAQLLQLSLRQCSNRALDFFHFFSVHVLAPADNSYLRNAIMALSRVHSLRADEEKRDFSLRKPTHSQEGMRKRKIGLLRLIS